MTSGLSALIQSEITDNLDVLKKKFLGKERGGIITSQPGTEKQQLTLH